jgi:hypothetical protein
MTESAFTGRDPSVSSRRTSVRHARPLGRPPGIYAAKRSAADLEVLSQRFVVFVRANPGLRIEQINPQLGTTTDELILPIRKAIEQGLITKKGKRRSTKYFANQVSRN